MTVNSGQSICKLLFGYEGEASTPLYLMTTCSYNEEVETYESTSRQSKQDDYILPKFY